MQFCNNSLEIEFISLMIKKIIHILGLFGLLLFLFACEKEEGVKTANLSFIDLSPIAVPEASGLADYSQGRYLTVSDSLSKVYVLSHDGKIIKTLSYTGNNLEGVTYNPEEDCIYVVEEKYGEIVKIDTNGQELDRFEVPIQNLDPRHGLEGISYNTANGHLYVVSEKDPSLLIELETDGSFIQSFDLNFAQDYSSVYYESQEGMLWILSEDSKTLTKTTLDGTPVITYNTGLNKGEGVVVDLKRALVFVITDTTSFFYIFALP